MFGLTNTWDDSIPSDQEVVAIAASRIRDFKLDFHERLDLSMPIGAILEWPYETCPDGFMELKGDSLSVASYPKLFERFGYKYGGSGDTFYLPDCRGLFVRCWANGVTGKDLDADAAVSCSGDISGTAVTSVTGLAGCPRLYSIVSGDGIATGTRIVAFTAFDSEGIPTGFTLSESATTGTAVAMTIDNNVNGSMQYDSNKMHSHIYDAGVPAGAYPVDTYLCTSISGATVNSEYSGGNEARPKNTTVMLIVRSDTI